MRVIKYCGDSSIELASAPVPKIGDNEVLIEVAYCGICGTDLHIADGKHPRAQKGLVMGHELSGTIREVNANSAFKVGDRVVIEPLISCGECYSCLAGFPHVCTKLGLYGIDEDGGFADYIRVKENRVFKIPDGISLVNAALIEPLAVGVHATRMSKLKVSDTVLVIGGGPIGYFVATAAKEAGAVVYIAEINPKRRKILTDMGFNLFDISNDESEFMKITDSKGFDIVFDCAGGPNTLLLSEKLVRIRGEIVIVAVPPEDRYFSYVPFSFKEISMVGIRVYEYYDFKRAIEMFTALPKDLTALYTTFELEDYKEAFKAAESGAAGMRVLFEIKKEH